MPRTPFEYGASCCLPYLSYVMYDVRMTQTSKLSTAAQTALIRVGTNRQGAKVLTTDAAVLRELTATGLIGVGNGLTMRGTIARERLVDALMEF